MSILKRVIDRKGVSGVIVALMLILVGVVAVVGISAFLDSKKTDIETHIDANISGGI